MTSVDLIMEMLTIVSTVDVRGFVGVERQRTGCANSDYPRKRGFAPR